MGNAGSSGDAMEDAALARVETLRDQLADMERAVRTLSHTPQQIEVLLPHQVRVHGHAVACDPDVRVLLGPVVGKVDYRSARVLLEVDRATTVTCHVLIFDARTQGFVEVPQSSVRIDVTAARRPVVFLTQSLLPGRQYRVVFSGVHREDAQRCSGSFRTPSGAGDLQCVVVSADDAYDLEYGERSLWSELKRSVVDEQSVQLVLHLGGQVAMKRMFDKAWTLLVRHAECAAPPVTAPATTGDTAASVGYSQAWALMEDQAMEILRSAYRTQWTMLQDKALVLANASNLMMWSDWDVYPAFTTSALFFVDHAQPTLEMQVLRTVVRCARRLYQEYQRALWDDIDQVFAREAELHSIAEQALATTARLHQLSQQQIPAAQNELEAQKKRRDIEAARKAERHLRALEAEKVTTEKTLVSYNQLLAPQSGEEFVYQVGATAFVLLDMRSARVEPGGSQRAESEVLSNVQWDFLERILEDESVTLVHICTEVPLVDDLPHELRLATESSPEECDFKTWWGSNSQAQQRLLALLFEWKLQQEGREVVLLSGSCNTRFSMKTTVRDTRLRTDIVQWLTGPLSALSSGRSIPSRVGVLFDRYSFEHGNIQAFEKSFIRLNISSLMNSSSTASPATMNSNGVCQIQRVDATVAQDPAHVLLGPIIGHVDAISAVVLLEIDRTCDLVCAVTNPLTGEKHRIFQHFEAGCPNSFFLNHLRSEHYYDVTFERIQHPDRYRGSFTTVAKMPENIQLIAISHDADELPPKHQTRSLWPWINENLGSAIPFRGADKIIHFERDSLGGAEASLLKNLVSDASRELLIAKLRDRQRLRWNMPGSQLLYCRGSHLILSESTVEDTEHGDSSQLILQDCIEQVHQEYENLLLPPSKRVSHPQERLQKPLQFVFGAFGMFVLPTALTLSTVDDSSLWTRLGEFLRTSGLSAVIIVTRKAIVEDSVEDAEEKARFQSSFNDSLVFQQEKLRRLLEILTAWHQQSPLKLDGSTPEASKIRSIVFLCGHQKRSFDSVIQDLTISSSAVPRPLRIQQFVIGPFQHAPWAQTHLQLSVFPQGTLFGKFGYYHRFQARASNPIINGEGESSVEAEARQTSNQDPLCQLFHLQISIKPAIDDTKELLLEPTFAVSDSVALVPPPNAAVFEDDSVYPVQVVDVARRDGDTSTRKWVLQTRQPAWLHHVVTQQLTEQEEHTLDALKTTLLDEKTAEIEQSFQRAQPLATGLVSAGNRANYVAHLHAAIHDFHQHIAGISFRTKYPAIPSAYIINFTLDDILSSDPTAITGAIDLDQYRAVLVKSFQNATLFESRLNTFWAPQV